MRITDSEQLKDRIGQSATIIGQVMKTESSKIVIESFDSKTITVRFSGLSSDDLGKNVEVVGTVESEKSLKLDSFTNLGDDFDMSLYTNTMKVMNHKKFEKITNRKLK